MDKDNAFLFVIIVQSRQQSGILITMNENKDESVKFSTRKHSFSSDDKLLWWGPGEWVEEVDFVKFEYKAIGCLIGRISVLDGPKQDFVSGGYLCGYVNIHKDHEMYGIIDNYDVDLDVHGGVTYSDFIGDDFYIGFDCAHSGDYIPSTEWFKKNSTHMIEFYKKFPIPKEYLQNYLFNPVYRNIDFCIEECKKLVNQIIKE